MIRNNSDGFTLVELVVTITILLLVLGGAYTLLLGGVKSYQVGEARLDAQQNARVALNRITREIRAARKVYFPGTISTVINSTEHKADDNDLFLEDDRGDTILFYLIENTEKELVLRRTVVGSGGHDELAYGLAAPDGLHLEYDGNPVRTVTVRIKTIDRKGKEFVLESKATIRVPGS